jgi:hypothetical protein
MAKPAPESDLKPESRLYNEIYAAVDRYSEENNLNYFQVVGVLEMVKVDIIEEAKYDKP